MKNIEIMPCYCGDFDFDVSKNAHQIRIKLDGWIGKLVWYLMYPIWKLKKRHTTITLKGEYQAIAHWKPILERQSLEKNIDKLLEKW